MPVLEKHYDPYSVVENSLIFLHTSIMTGEPCIPHQKKVKVPCTPVISINYCLKRKYQLQFCQLQFVQPVTQLGLFETHLCNQSSYYEKYMGNIHFERKRSHATIKSTCFANIKSNSVTKSSQLQLQHLFFTDMSNLWESTFLQTHAVAPKLLVVLHMCI